MFKLASLIAVAFLATTAALVASAATLSPALTATAQPAAPPPNILLVIIDDFGVDASPCYDAGADKPAMPTLAALCATGLVFEHAWATPECSPTRATLLTGQHGFRTGVGGAGDRLDPATPSLLQALAGATPLPYANAVIGKWHLSGPGELDHPARLGVQHYAGFLRGELPDYTRWPKVTDGRAGPANGYATSVFTDDALAWVTGRREPWLLWLAYTAPHAPWHLPPAALHDRADLSGAPADIAARPRDYYFAAAEALDRELGRLLAGLDAATRAHTTIIVLGDNGTPGQVAQAPYPRNQTKGTLYEGGIGVPLIVAGAGVTRPGEREPALVQSVDVAATIAALAGVGGERFADGVSFAPLLGAPGVGARAYAYSESFGGAGPGRGAAGDGWTARDERYQLFVWQAGGETLVDLLTDPGGRVDLLAGGTPTAAQQAAADRLRAWGRALRGE